MSITVKLSDELIKSARRFGKAHSRSVPKQIEYWSRIGRIAEENPDLPYDFIKNLLVAMQDVKDGKVTPYVPNEN